MMSYVIAIFAVVFYFSKMLGDGDISIEATLLYLIGMAVITVLWEICDAVKDAVKH